MNRRQFLTDVGLAMGAVMLTPATAQSAQVEKLMPRQEKWRKVREQFLHLDNGKSEYVPFFFASHPKPVFEAINAHRLGLDRDPYGYFVKNVRKSMQTLSRVGAQYLEVSTKEIAWTDSTTMGISLLYNGLMLKPHQQILTSNNEHYATKTALELRHQRFGNPINTIALYKDIQTVSKTEIVNSIVSNINKDTRVLALTWVDSATGLKLPVRDIADALEPINAKRAHDDKVLLCIDGVHGFGIEQTSVGSLGCDFFMAGCHKWLFGPRGTGLLWGKSDAWQHVLPTIPSFVMKELANQEYGLYNTPGGFKSFEHYWSISEAFKFHLSLGKQDVAERIHHLNSYLKQGLAKIDDVEVITPQSSELSAGIVAFEVKGHKKRSVKKYLHSHDIYVSTPTKAHSYHLRLAPGLQTSEQELDLVLAALSAGAQTSFS